MDDNKIVYDSNEISSIMSKIGNNSSIVESDIVNSLTNDFSMLQELDLFAEGLNKLSSKASQVISLNNRLLTRLSEHDSNMNELNKKHTDMFNNIDDYTDDSGVYSGEVVSIDEITLSSVPDGKLILSEYIGSVIFKFPYDKKLVLLKKILNDGKNSLDIITDSKQSDILIYQLKEVLKEDYSIDLGKLTTEEEKELQKAFFNSICDENKNIFDEIEQDSILKGMSYFKEVCSNNNISVTDLLYDDNNKDLFVNALKDIYNNQLESLTANETLSVRSYIDNVASSNKIEVSKLLEGSEYSSILKGGIHYEN